MEAKPSDVERANFCERLSKSLLNAGCPLSGTALAREFNLRAVGSEITVHGARKWLHGEAYPTHERLRVLSRWLGVSAQ